MIDNYQSEKIDLLEKDLNKLSTQNAGEDYKIIMDLTHANFKYVTHIVVNKI